MAVFNLLTTACSSTGETISGPNLCNAHDIQDSVLISLAIIEDFISTVDCADWSIKGKCVFKRNSSDCSLDVVNVLQVL